jgi:glycosyltransferase involved in cell wall biosynthesis
VKPYLAEASVLAVPLDAGGGTRLKILEAFASGLPVISTRIGAEGLAAEPGTHYGQAERPDFAGAVADLLGCPAAGTRLAQAARALVRRTYDWQLIGERAAAHVLAAAGRQPASAILEGRSGSPGRAPGDPDES